MHDSELGCMTVSWNSQLVVGVHASELEFTTGSWGV